MQPCTSRIFSNVCIQISCQNKIRRLLGRIMVLESKTPRRSRRDFYTLKVENFRKIWITYGNQGQGGFSTTSGILVDYHFPKRIACTNNQLITCIMDSLRRSNHKFSSKWAATFPTWKHTTVFLTIKKTSMHHRFHSRHALAAGHSGGIFTAASPMARAPMLVKTFSPLTPHSAIYPSH